MMEKGSRRFVGFVSAVFVTVMMLVYAACGPAMPRPITVETYEQIEGRLYRALGISPQPSRTGEWVERMAGAVNPGVDFSGLWYNANNGDTLTVVQQGNLLIIVRSNGSEQWRINGSVAYALGFLQKGSQNQPTFCLLRVTATLLGPDTLRLENDVGCTMPGIQSVEMANGTLYFSRISATATP